MYTGYPHLKENSLLPVKSKNIYKVLSLLRQQHIITDILGNIL